MRVSRDQIRNYLENHDFGELFNQLGWDWPESDRPYPVEIGEKLYQLRPIAYKRGFAAYHCPCMPDSATRGKIDTRLSRDVREHLIIFTDPESKRQRWQWVRRESGQPLSRKEHEYHPGQPMLLIEKLNWLEVRMEEEEKIDLIDVADKVRTAFDTEKITKRFFERFKKEHEAFREFIDGISDIGEANWYSSVMLNRLMFIYFIQKKRFLDGDPDYLRNRLRRVQELRGRDQFQTFYRYFLLTLCHEALAKKEPEIDPELAALIGKVPYLNGGIFMEHELEVKHGDCIDIPDEAFERIFDFFDQYDWYLDNRPNAKENEIDPDVLGYIFEKYINQKQMGAYYTKEDITEYISKNTIIPCLFDKVRKLSEISFKGETSVWRLLQEDPDRYIYPAMRHGITYDVHHGVEIAEPVAYPPEIEIGLDPEQPDLLERRKHWNTPTPPEAGLPTEIWRETVARRQRYYEVRHALENLIPASEMQKEKDKNEAHPYQEEKSNNSPQFSINDLITYNCDIRQFAQDVIERCESPDLLNAFWVAIAGRLPRNSREEVKPGITVLDPTCGSGAFLFAALNVLEPLYEACLNRMDKFLEEWRDSKAHANYSRFFRSIRDDIEQHPSPKYFIYKSIIIHNLYGVDIMKEAVEICKLRLFLKLAAQVEGETPFEPLPDIDFNIRAGNTLVGFASEEAMKEAMSGDLLAYSTVLPEILEQAEECDRCYNLFRKAQLEEDDSQASAKARLSEKLDALNARLNQYLAQDYGIDPKNTEQYQTFLNSHQPFHWFIEFFGIMKNGGFDAVIGNPPYVEYSEVKKEYFIKGYETEECGNLYAYCLERCFNLLHGEGYNGMIVQLPIVCTDRMIPLQNKCYEQNRLLWFQNFDDRPARLFDGLEHIRATIIITKKGYNTPKVFSSRYHRWYSDFRPFLFFTLKSVSLDHTLWTGTIPKIGTCLAKEILSKITGKESLSNFVEPAGDFPVYFHNAPQYWNRATQFKPYFWNERNGYKLSAQIKFLYCRYAKIQTVISSVLNSALFYWWYIIRSDCRHLNNREVYSFPLDSTALRTVAAEQLKELIDSLMEDLKRNSKRKHCRYKTTGRVEYDEYYPRYSKPIIDEIDKVLAEHYGFTEEELDFIINYDIKYRMGDALFDGGE